MEIINRKLSLQELEDYVATYNFGTLPANKLVIHHTWRPTKEQWQGQKSINGLKAYYEGKGWGAGPHLFVAEDGIWLFSPMRKDGIHAGTLNPRSVGMEVVGDYDTAKWEGETKYNALGAIKVLTEALHLAEKDIFFHRDASPKSCPGWAITKEWLFAELQAFHKRPKIPAYPRTTDELLIPSWAVEAVAFVRQNSLFEISNGEDVRDAVKFFRLYQLIQKNHG